MLVDYVNPDDNNCKYRIDVLLSDTLKVCYKNESEINCSVQGEYLDDHGKCITIPIDNCIDYDRDTNLCY